MHPRPAAKSPYLLALLLAACASGSGLADQPAQADAMVTWIERVNVEAERAREAIGDSMQRFSVLAAGKFDRDPATVVFARFVQSIDVADQQAHRYRDVVAPMLASAQPVFDKWQADLKTIANERLRQRGELRYAVAKERYDAIIKVAVPAQDQFDKYVRSLRDHAAFLAHDLNAAALDDIQAEVKLVAQSARELDRGMESCMEASRAYVEQATLPVAPGR